KDLNLGNCCGRRDVGKQGWREEVALRRTGPGRLPERSALFDALINQVLDLTQLTRRDNSGHINRFIQWLSYPQSLHTGAQFREDALSHVLLHQQTRASATYLTLVKPDRINDALHHAIQVRVIKDDKGRFASQLQRELLARSSGGPPDATPDIGG